MVEITSDQDSSQHSGHPVRKKSYNNKTILIVLFIIIISTLIYVIPTDIFKMPPVSIGSAQDITDSATSASIKQALAAIVTSFLFI